MNLFRRMLVVVAAAVVVPIVPVTPAAADSAGCADLSGLRLPAAPPAGTRH